MRTSIAEQENESPRDGQSCAPGNFGQLPTDLLEITDVGEFLPPGRRSFVLSRYPPGVRQSAGGARENQESQMSFHFASASLHQLQLVQIPKPKAVDLSLKQVHARRSGSHGFSPWTRADDSNRITGFQLRFHASSTCGLTLYSLKRLCLTHSTCVRFSGLILYMPNSAS
jgi:hypothetical protein